MTFLALLTRAAGRRLSLPGLGKPAAPGFFRRVHGIVRIGHQVIDGALPIAQSNADRKADGQNAIVDDERVSYGGNAAAGDFTCSVARRSRRLKLINLYHLVWARREYISVKLSIRSS